MVVLSADARFRFTAIHRLGKPFQQKTHQVDVGYPVSRQETISISRGRAFAQLDSSGELHASADASANTKLTHMFDSCRSDTLSGRASKVIDIFQDFDFPPNSRAWTGG